MKLVDEAGGRRSESEEPHADRARKSRAKLDIRMATRSYLRTRHIRKPNNRILSYLREL
jgi:hypothetical protein